ncbi:hypothetical protein C8Q75DRAFT_808385 [Abortiporus biennis]|nr:hypothetical protein C8Q75DRAFT_808385 [Abortiporus biennis]
MSALFAAARVPLRQAALRAPARRFAHTEEYKHLPFETANRVAFGTKLAAYLITGFSIPFIAAAYQISKSS